MHVYQDDEAVCSFHLFRVYSLWFDICFKLGISVWGKEAEVKIIPCSDLDQ